VSTTVDEITAKLDAPPEKGEAQKALERRQAKIASSYPRVTNKFNADLTFKEIFKECTRQNNRLQKWRNIMLERGLGGEIGADEEFLKVLEAGRLHKQAQRRMKKFNHYFQMNLEQMRRNLPPIPEMGPEARNVLKREIILLCWDVYEIYCHLLPSMIESSPDGNNWDDPLREFEYDPDA
jgi:hypothetical protein